MSCAGGILACSSILVPAAGGGTTLRRCGGRCRCLRSDYIMEPVGNQGHTYALSMWMPFYGTGTSAIDAYKFRSVMCPSFTACYDMRRKDLDYGKARHLLKTWREVGPACFGDYYPLTPYTLADDAWIAWQFDRPEEGDGFIQAFRREGSVYRVAELKLHGLDADKDYAITDLDTDKTTRTKGRELMEHGLTIEIATKPGAVLLASHGGKSALAPHVTLLIEDGRIRNLKRCGRAPGRRVAPTPDSAGRGNGNIRMKKKPKTSAAAARLRRRAEARVQKRRKTPRPGAGGSTSAADTRRLVNELQVHQIQLEMQNEELSQAIGQAEAAADKFSDLYDFAPVGYVTLDRKGTIRQVNLSGARLLGLKRGRLLNRRLGNSLPRATVLASAASCKRSLRAGPKSNAK